MEKDLQLAEAGYEERLRDALRRCINGQWGLFGANDAAHAAHFGANRIPANDASELIDRAGHIAELRVHLGHAEPFPLHERFMAYRTIATVQTLMASPSWLSNFSMRSIAMQIMEERRKTWLPGNAFEGCSN